jgi:hypothetical protein
MLKYIEKYMSWILKNGHFLLSLKLPKKLVIYLQTTLITCIKKISSTGLPYQKLMNFKKKKRNFPRCDLN